MANQEVGNLFKQLEGKENFALQPTHEDTVKNAAEKILNQSIPWDGYKRADLIKDNELELIKKYDKKPEDARRQLIQKVLHK